MPDRGTQVKEINVVKFIFLIFREQAVNRTELTISQDSWSGDTEITFVLSYQLFFPWLLFVLVLFVFLFTFFLSFFAFFFVFSFPVSLIRSHHICFYVAVCLSAFASYLCLENVLIFLPWAKNWDYFAFGMSLKILQRNTNTKWILDNKAKRWKSNHTLCLSLCLSVCLCYINFSN